MTKTTKGLELYSDIGSSPYKTSYHGTFPLFDMSLTYNELKLIYSICNSCIIEEEEHNVRIVRKSVFNITYRAFLILKKKCEYLLDKLVKDVRFIPLYLELYDMEFTPTELEALIKEPTRRHLKGNFTDCELDRLTKKIVAVLHKHRWGHY
ncbi:MAG: hypothetical protein K8823_1532 [Cenarchaeum symbiont of Oopsacas minuta]|nr:hypothetical protein [Cenarchaeum symbiont of Oopsacas minuta]